MKRHLLFVLLFLSFNFVSSQEKFELREEVHKYLSESNSNFNFAMIAEAYRNENRIAFFWPCLMDSVLVDDKVLAVAFEKQNDEWVSYDMFIASKDSGMHNFIRVIGGTDYKIVKPNGIPLENLGNFMLEKIRNSQNRILQKENEKAIIEIEEFSRAFGLISAVFSRSMTGFIMRGAKILEISEIKISDVVTVNNNGSATLDVYFPKEATSNKVKLVKIGSGWAIDAVD